MPKWLYIGANKAALQSYEFYENGEFKLNLNLFGNESWAPGLYEIEGNQLILNYDLEQFGTEVFEVTISENQLTLILLNKKSGEEFIFNRQQ